MYLNPEQWFDEHKATMPREIVANFERLRMHLRGWALYEEISGPLAKEMIAHALSKVDDPSTIELLYETLTDCANYYIMTLCAEVEALVHNSKENVPTDVVEDEIMRRNKLFDEGLNQESWEGSKVMLRETIDIFQRSFFAKKKELMDIESKWWPFYKYSFQFHGMKWHVDAYEIVLELRKRKKPNELIRLTHQDEFNAVKELVEAIEEAAKETEE
jgi:hypothetical protein